MCDTSRTVSVVDISPVMCSGVLNTGNVNVVGTSLLHHRVNKTKDKVLEIGIIV